MLTPTFSLPYALPSNPSTTTAPTRSRSMRRTAALAAAAGVVGALLWAAGPAAALSDVNHLAGVPYAASVAADPSYPDSGGELTDGVHASPLLADPAWQGRWNPGTYSFTADLGGEEAVTAFTATFYKYLGAGVELPTGVTFLGSSDGTTWTTACGVPQQSPPGDVVAVPHSCSPAPGFTATHVRLVVTATAASWSFLDEWTALGPADNPGACTATDPHLNGSFLQPDLGDSWSAGEWAAELDHLADACLTDLVLQWTADSKAETTIYPSGLPGYTQSTTTDVVQRALDAADLAGAQVYLGLQVNDDWWTTYANDPQWLADQATIAQDLANDLWSGYGAHPSLTGWYLSFEVDNWNFTTQASWDTMASFYDSVADYLHTLTPGKPVVISPFFNTAGGLTPTQWTTMWTSILSQSEIDVIALQDGVGAGHATTGQLATWFSATASAITAASAATELWADTETFNLEFQPLDTQTIVADMAAVEPYVSRYWSFAYHHYQSPQQVDPVHHQTYLDYLDTGAVESNPPTTPTGLTATAVNPLTVDVSWNASTDDTGIAGYQIYRNSELVAVRYGTGTSLTDGGLDPATSYTYSVVAFDAAGNTSGASPTDSATTPSGPSYPTNLAAGRPYTASLPADAAYPDGGGELTDETYGTTNYADVAWQGRNTASPYTFTIDLGATYPIREINSDWLQVKSVFIFLPAEVSYAVSTDGSTFTAVGTVPAPNVSDADQARPYRLIGLNTTGRYLRVSAEPFSSAWSFIDEVEVRTDSTGP